MRDLLSGDQLDHYLLEAVIGKGGMGIVFLAEDLNLQRKVAVKLLSADLSTDHEFVDRFLRESRLAASIDHPHIIPVYDAGEVDGRVYLVMRYVDGPDLKDLLLRDGRMEADRAVALIGQVARALDAAHGRGLVHRDVKPANILVAAEERGSRPIEHAYLCDFGIVREGVAGATAPGQFLGTPDYTAPEQLRGEPVDARADVYALACVLYQCLVGHAPYPGADVGVMLGHLQEPPPRPSSDRPELGAGFDEMIARGMAKMPAERYPTCGALAAAAAGAERKIVVARPPIRRPERRVWSRPRVAAVIALLVIVVGVVVVGAERIAGRTPKTGQPPTAAVGGRVPVGTIAFVISNAPGNPFGRLTEREPGSSAKPVTAHGLYRSPTWSPDRRELAAIRQTPGGEGQLVVLRVGGTPKVVAPQLEPRAAAWSPTTTSIATLGDEAGKFGSDGLWLVDPRTGTTHRIARDPLNQVPESLAWATSGSSIAVASDTHIHTALKSAVTIFQASTGAARPVPIEPGGIIDGLTWARPDRGTTQPGNLVLSIQRPRQSADLFWMRFALFGKPRHFAAFQLAVSPNTDIQPVFSNDDKLVVFATGTSASQDLAEVTMSSGVVRTLVHVPQGSFAWTPAWAGSPGAT